MSSLVELLLFFAFMYPIIFAVMVVLDVLGAWVVLRNCLCLPQTDCTPAVSHRYCRPPLIDLAEVERARLWPARGRPLPRGRAWVCQEAAVQRMIRVSTNLRGTVSSIL